MADFRKPNINAPTTEGQLSQVKSYLYQLTNQLNFALKAANEEEKQRGYSSLNGGKNGTDVKSGEDTAEDTFLKLKNLIIKSADIVNAYYEVIEQRLSGEYVAQSDFGEYKETTDAFILQTSENQTQYYTSVKEIKDAMGNLSELRKDDCYIRTGWLDDEETIAGVEIGKTSAEDEAPKNAFARFTTEELVFYDGNGTEEKNRLGWFSQYKLNVRAAKIEGDLVVNDYLLDTANGIAFKWVGDS